MKKKVGNSMGQEEKYMDEYIKEISEKIEDKKEYYAKISDKILGVCGAEISRI